MLKVILIHYSEIGLKGKNRQFFEDRLVKNIQASLKPVADFKVKKIFGRLIIEGSTGKNWPQVKERLQKIFGIANFTLAERISFTSHPGAEPQPGRSQPTAGHPQGEIPGILTSTQRVLLRLIRTQKFKSFRISARRAQKDFSLTSQELNEKLGAFVQQKTGAKVDLKNPEITFYVEVVNKDTFIYTDFKKVETGRDLSLQRVIKGPGGLPVGVSGKAICLISGGIDSPVAAWLMMKRGMQIYFVHFHSFPQTDQASRQKVREIVKILNGWQPFCCHSRAGGNLQYERKMDSRRSLSRATTRGGNDNVRASVSLKMMPFLSFQKKVVAKTPSKYRVILYRREMLRQAEKIAKKIKAQALITGESLGQVASQTIENLAVIEEAITLPVLRPLIGFDKQEIINLAQKISTYNISIEPYQDCCSLFIPKHPATKANLQKVKQAEKLIK